ncbi:MAG: exosortase system-associated protein, TIGR04073 family [Verrucomicrobia bacterium]|nr:exosortase system-associated protein, TIGR04073 family [Verrucomicrobiota bacterium]
MRTSLSLLCAATVVAVLAVGCAGPEQKLGRGVNNLTEFVRMGEIRRSVEQTALWEGPETGYTQGFLHGFDRSVARTAVGAFEVLTFPFPSYDPTYLPAKPVYPDSYRPQLLEDPTFGPDSTLGFSGGDVAPIFPGSRFRIFDN